MVPQSGAIKISRCMPENVVVTVHAWEPLWHCHSMAAISLHGYEQDWETVLSFLPS